MFIDRGTSDASLSRQRTVVNNMINNFDAEITNNSPWSLLCGLVPMVYKGVPKKAEITFIENKLSEAKGDANVSHNHSDALFCC